MIKEKSGPKMPKAVYVYKLRKSVPLLGDADRASLTDMLRGRVASVIEYHRKTGCSLEKARRLEPIGQAALTNYHKITGATLEHPDEIWCTRRSDFDSLCPQCSKPFRTAEANLCAECGFTLPLGEVAGPL
ncbi:hypothetical protein [Ruegeria meonggei]|uniref:hypothetical protein n=1 Tax=Ruegeria meonggei TaxID=1446476 RepID=UPI00366C95F7